MYTFLLPLHSLVRWLLLAAIVISLVRSWAGWKGDRTFTKADHILRMATASLAHIQLIAGLWLYFISPVVAYFLANFKEAVHLRQIRFFGMEHISIMLTAIVIITIGSSVAKRRPDDKLKHKAIAVYYTIALILILSSIPWAFSPLVARPWFRSF